MAEQFTTADRVALFAIEMGLAPAPWQFDFLAHFYATPTAHASGGESRGAGK